jgi:DNA repair exonuclease SbcCD ATPase subunit
VDVGQVREQLNREVQEVRALIDQLHHEDPSYAQGGAGLTFEGQGMTLSAPGTEAFKQDFAKWQEMKRQVSAALEQVESTLAKKLQERNAKDRLSAGADDQAPAAYQHQVDSYFKALATRKKQ